MLDEFRQQTNNSVATKKDIWKAVYELRQVEELKDRTDD